MIGRILHLFTFRRGYNFILCDSQSLNARRRKPRPLDSFGSICPQVRPFTPSSATFPVRECRARSNASSSTSKNGLTDEKRDTSSRIFLCWLRTRSSIAWTRIIGALSFKVVAWIWAFTWLAHLPLSLVTLRAKQNIKNIQTRTALIIIGSNLSSMKKNHLYHA